MGARRSHRPDLRHRPTPLGIATWALLTGRLNILLRASPAAPLIAWALLLLGAFPLWRQLPRLALAAGPSLLLSTGLLDRPLQTSHIPTWLAWLTASLLSLLLSPRLFLYGVLPTLGIYLLLSKLT